MNFRFFESPLWDIQNIRPPWGNRPSIYQHILTHIRPGGPGLDEDGEDLPDEERLWEDDQLTWAPGALDGVLGHRSGDDDAADDAQMDLDNEAAEGAQMVLTSLRALTEKATDARARALYDRLTEYSALEYVDQLLSAVVNDNNLPPERLRTVARWLATGAADREPVKCAIALLGIFQGDEDRDLLLMLGRHEEFTLYAAVALQNSGAESELSLWALACLVTGWGRIQIIERLADTKDDQIKAWLLRDGYRNDIMYEYTALICARTGDLLSALRRRDPDERLLKGAGALLSTLIQGRGGSSEGIEAYTEGAEAAELYLSHLQQRELDLEDFVDVIAIERFLNEGGGEAHDPLLGWPERRLKLLELIRSIRSRPGWEDKIREGLESCDRRTYWTAIEAAKATGLDIWEIYIDRIEQGEDDWYFAMQTDDPGRIDRVVQLAEKILPLDEIATGPAEELGLGPEYQDHTTLDLVLQELRRFSGKGWPLIRAGLQSPVVRNRNMAVRALSAWNRSEWPKGAEALLRRALEAEPNEETREMMRKALAGEPTEFES